MRRNCDLGDHPVGEADDHLPLIPDFPLMDTKLIGAACLRDPCASIPDHKPVKAVVIHMEQIFLIGIQ